MPKLHRIAPLIGYTLLSLVVTWPLVTQLQGWVPGFGDWGQNVWALWWTRQALLVQGESPFFTRYLFYPEGITLLFHPLDLTDGLIALPFYGLAGGDVSYNLIVLLSFVLAGLGGYYLALHLTRQRGAAFVAGLIFALSPYHFLRLELGHLNLASIQWIPFYLVFLLKFVREGRTRWAVLAVFFMLLNAWCSWYYVIACSMVSLAIPFLPVAGSPTLYRRVGRTALVLVLVGLILSPLMGPMFQLLHSTEWMGEHNPLRHSVDGLSFWLPGPPSAWSGWFEPLWSPYAAQHREPGASAYLGYSVILLGMAGLVGRWRETWGWLLVGGWFIMVAMGPQLQVAGEIFETKLPYYYLDAYVPGFSISGIPGRFVVMSSLVSAVLAGYGLTVLSRRWSPHTSWLTIVAGGLVILEFWAAPVAGSSTRLPQFYTQLAADAPVYAVLDFKWDANYLLHAQTVHQKPLLGGWLARMPKAQAAYLDQGSPEQVISAALLGGQATPTDPAQRRQMVNDSLAQRQVRYIIDHNGVLGNWLTEQLGWRSVYTESGKIVVYEKDGQSARHDP
ncbi:MAG: hypothetical protein HC875_41165 [Anaerolineales bacterium]|nr:hypothetical protein [Anaerolineales bacterium]